jgi:nucleotide-binding universal stress UspA family protein
MDLRNDNMECEPKDSEPAMYKHVLVPLDGSTLAEEALPHAEALASVFDSRITLMSCVEPYVISLPMVPTPVPAYDIDMDLDALTADRRKYLDTLRKKLAKKGLSVEIRACRGRGPDEILRFADEKNVDLIVMTTHGRSGIGRFIYGSVAERVIHGAKTPVLLIRSGSRG